MALSCKKCGTDNSAGRKFCGECGSPLETICASCGFVNEGGVKFCGGCGTSFNRTPTLDTLPALGSKPSEKIAEELITSKISREGERKQITVLFADTKGSMELLAARDPEDARSILDPLLERMMEAVRRFGGTVNQVMGDGIMALFGAPIAQEDHAVRACYAALRMQETIRRFTDELARSRGLEVAIRIGLNTGEVVVRAVGSDLRMDYSAVGQATHLAARMEQLATPGTARMTAATKRLVEGYVEARPLGLINVKGLAEPIEAFELAGLGWAKTPFEISERRGLTSFVGREKEVERIREALRDATGTRGRAVLVSGDPGVGKSRLILETKRSDQAAGWRIMEGGSLAHTQASYAPLVEMLRGYFQISERSDVRAAAREIEQRVTALDPALADTVAALSSLLDLPAGDPKWGELAPADRKRRTIESLVRLFVRESETRPLMIVVEDAHWLDSETQTVLDTLVEVLSSQRILLIVSARPQYPNPWASRKHVEHLVLQPLGADGSKRILDLVLGNHPELSSLKSLLIERTGGNALFLEESVRSLVESGVLSGERGNYRMERSVEAIQVPESVQAIIAARIDRLEVEEKRLLQSASVIGKDVPAWLLEAVSELRGEVFRRALARLQSAHLLTETRMFPDLEYSFVHALMLDVAHAGLLQDRRRALHAAIVDAIEKNKRDDHAASIERLAHHAYQGQLWWKAVRYLREAGTKALLRSSNREAAATFERALLALSNVAESKETLEMAVDLRFDLRNALVAFGQFGPVVDRLREAEAIAEKIPDGGRLAMVGVYLGNLDMLRGDPRAARDRCDRARRLAEENGQVEFGLLASYHLGIAEHSLGNHRSALDCFRRVVAFFDHEKKRKLIGLPGPPGAQARLWVAYCLAELGEPGEAMRTGEEAVEIATASGNLFAISTSTWSLGFVHLWAGDLEGALPQLERSVAACREMVNALWLPSSLATLALARALAGDSRGAGQLIDEGKTAPPGPKGFRALGRVLFGRASVFAGRDADARAFAEESLALARECGQRGYEALALALSGDIASRWPSEQGGTAIDQWTAALALAEELALRPLAAECHAELGRLYSRAGDTGRAQVHLESARRSFEELDQERGASRQAASLGGNA